MLMRITRSSYLSDSVVLEGDFVRPGSLSTNVHRHSPAKKKKKKNELTHWTKSLLLPGYYRQLINTVEFLSLYSKNHLLLSMRTYLFHPLKLRKGRGSSQCAWPHPINGLVNCCKEKVKLLIFPREVRLIVNSGLF